MVALAANPMAADAADMGAKSIEGTVRVRADLAQHIGPGDRLVFKLFHPKGASEKDIKFQIITTFTLPYDFRVSPSTDMSGRSKWRDYVVEVFTDRDGDIMSVAPGELMGRSARSVPLGSQGVVVDLENPGK